MKKIFEILAVILFVFGMSSGVYASDDDDEGDSTNNTNTNINTPIAIGGGASANANQYINNTPITVVAPNITTTVNPVAIGLGGNGGQGGEANASASSGSYSSSGALSMSGSLSSIGDISVNIHNPNPLPPAASVPSVEALSPALYNPDGKGANAQGQDLVQKYLDECGTVSEDGVDRDELHEKGRTRLTNISWTPHNNYEKYGNNKKVTSVEIVASEKLLMRAKYRFTCIGILQVEAIGDDEVGKVNMATIQNDATTFLKGRLSGHRKLIAIKYRTASSVNLGVVSQGGGFGFSAGASKMIGNLLGTSGASGTMSDGSTFGATQVGDTYVIVTEDSFEGAAMIDIAKLQ